MENVLKQIQNSIRVRLTLAFLGLAAVPLLIVGISFTYNAYTAQIQDAIALQREMAEHLSSRVKSLIDNIEDELKTLIRLEDLQKLEPDRQKLVLSIFHSRQSAIEELVLLDAEGRVLSYHSRIKLQIDASWGYKRNLDLFGVPMSQGRTYFGPVRFQDISGEPLMVISIPIIDLDTGKPEGVLVADVRLKEIWELVASIKPGDRGDSFIIDSQKRVVAHSNPSVVLRGTFFDPPVFDGVVMGLNNQNSVSVSRRVSLGGQQFHTVVEEPVSDALALAIDTVAIMSVILFIVLLIAGGLGFLTVRVIVKPIENIAETARAINSGDLSRRAVVKSHDEIGDLATAFNGMTMQLQMLINDLEKRVADRTTELEASNQDLEAFAYSVSHDLRAPLRHIGAFVEMLQKRIGHTLDEKSHHYINTIFNAANKMGQLIDDLLSFSRMGRQALTIRQLNLQDLMADVIGDLEPGMADRTVEWRFGQFSQVSGDAAMIRIVLTNLISNALKFTEACNKAVIEIGSQSRVQETVVYIRDNGVGFDMKYADKLFGVFQRLHRQDEFEGTGIGLAIVQRIINRHGGRIWGEGEPGKGATFSFTLPKS